MSLFLLCLVWKDEGKWCSVWRVLKQGFEPTAIFFTHLKQKMTKDSFECFGKHSTYFYAE